MNILDIFRGDAFSIANLTESIVTIPNRYSRVTGEGLFQPRGVNGKTVIIENQNGVLSLIQSTAWGGAAAQHKTGKRNARSFVIPHMPIEDRIAAEEIMGVRQFGTADQFKTIGNVVNQKLQEIKDNIDQTMEWRQMSALKGVVTDADGSTIYDLFTEFGVTRKTINFALNVATTDVRAKCMELARHIEDKLHGESMSRVHVLVSPEFFDALVSHAKVKEAFGNYAEASQRLGGDLRKGFNFGGVTFEEYRGQIGASRFIAAGEAQAYPVGTSTTFRDYAAPADFLETVNTTGQAYYARQWIDDDNRGINIHAQSNRLPLCLRPEVLVNLTLS